MIEEVDIKLPKTEKAIKNYFLSCKNRRKFVTDIKDHYKKRLKKSKHDLKCAIDVSETYHWLRSQWTKSTFYSRECYVSEHAQKPPDSRWCLYSICHPRRGWFLTNLKTKTGTGQ